MIKPEHIMAYRHLCPELKLTEKVVGTGHFDWQIACLQYKVDRTFGVPYELLDRVLVELLGIESPLSFQQIGSILGLNVIHSPQSNQILDQAEVSLLKQALDSLESEGMIEVGDIDYIRCRLTDTGAFYAGIGKKFRVQPDHYFSLLADKTADFHHLVKFYFENRSGAQENLEDSPVFYDPNWVKNLISVQLPDIHDPEKGNTYSNLEFDLEGSYLLNVPLMVFLILDLQTLGIRALGYEPHAERIIPEISQWLTEYQLDSLLEDKLDQQIMQSPQSAVLAAFESYTQKIVQCRVKWEPLWEQEPSKAVIKAQKLQKEGPFWDPGFFWDHLEEFIPPNAIKVHVHLSVDEPYWKEKMTKLFSRFPDLKMLFTYPERELELEETIANNQNLGEGKALHFVEGLDENWSSFLLIQTDTSEVLFTEQVLTFSVSENELYFFQVFRSDSIPSELLRFSEQAWQTAANTALACCRKELQEISVYALGQKEIWRKDLNEIVALDCPFQALLPMLPPSKQSEVVELHNQKNELIFTMKNMLKDQLRQRGEQILTRIQACEKLDGGEKQVFEKEIQFIESQLDEDFIEEKDLVGELKMSLAELIRFAYAKTYVIDTNVFVEQPDIMEQLPKGDRIALNLTVIEELDILKHRTRTSEAAKKAIRQINKALIRAEGNRSRIRKVKAKLKNLPRESRKNSPDNYILSIAKTLTNENAVLLTYDKNLQNKARLLDIPVMEPQKVSEGGRLPKLDYLKIFRKVPTNKNGKITVPALIEAIRKEAPDFDYKTLGFAKASDLVMAIPGLELHQKRFVKLQKS